MATSSQFSDTHPAPGPSLMPPNLDSIPTPQSPDPLPLHTTVNPVQFQPGAAPLIENGWSTYYSSWGFDPSSIQPLDPLYTFDLHQHGFSDRELGTLSQGLFQNPWAKGAEGAWYSAGGANTAWHDLATQTHTELPNEQGQVELQPEPRPGVIGREPQDSLPAERPYNRIVSGDRVIYQHPTAGQSYGKGQMRWEAEYNKNNKIRGGNPYAMWASKDEWEVVKWMATMKVSQSSINDLLKTERYREAGYSFTNAKALFKKIEHEMGGFGGPKWNAEDVFLSDAPHDKTTLFYRKLDDCADFLFGRPQFAGKLAFGPEMHYNSDEATRLYDNPWTADDWNERQVSSPLGVNFGN
ncbi:hypothetical protein FRC10_000496 [Ceratobasidium sp. 414]|nr:hypothetical protein FRC10_000496 [Ceratobasidium sp. 414]